MGEKAVNTNDGDDWQNEFESIEDKIDYVYETSEFHDCEFVVGTKPNQEIFKGHKFVLAIWSPAFAAMFYGDLAEQGQVSIPDMESNIFRKILKYIYKNTIEFKSFEEASAVYYGAKKYLLARLVEKCVKYMETILTPSTVCKIYEFAKYVEEQKLKEQCEKVLIEKTDAVLREVVFEEISLETVVFILKQETLNINTELELFTALEKWIKQNDEVESIKNSLAVRDALKHIRYLTMDSSEFAKGPANSVLLTDEEKIAIFKYMCTRDSKNHSLPNSLSHNVIPRKKVSDSKNHSLPNSLSHNVIPQKKVSNLPENLLVFYENMKGEAYKSNEILNGTRSRSFDLIIFTEALLGANILGSINFPYKKYNMYQSIHYRSQCIGVVIFVKSNISTSIIEHSYKHVKQLFLLLKGTEKDVIVGGVFLPHYTSTQGYAAHGLAVKEISERYPKSKWIICGNYYIDGSWNGRLSLNHMSMIGKYSIMSNCLKNVGLTQVCETPNRYLSSSDLVFTNVLPTTVTTDRYLGQGGISFSIKTTA